MENFAVIGVDPQIDFCPGGALAVEEGEKIMSPLNEMARKALDAGGTRVLTQDFHPDGHLSFASAHKGKKPYDEIKGVPGIGPILWPNHCVIGTKGVNFHHDLNTDLFQSIIRKGNHPKIDSYSGFKDNDDKYTTGLEGLLKELGIKTIFIGGLAFDVCVKFTAIDAAKAGFTTYVVMEATRGVFPDKVEENKKELTDHNVQLIETVKDLPF